MPSALTGITVVETGLLPSVPFAGRLLRCLGADVSRVQTARPIHGLNPTLWAFLNEQKTVIPSYVPLGEALAGAQIWLDGRTLDEIEADLERAPADVVHVVITPFGMDGPWASKAGTGIVASAMGGLLHICGASEREPLKNGGFVVEFQTGLFAALGALAGLLHLTRSGDGMLVETSLLESVIAFQERADIAWTHQGANWRRARRHEVAHPFTVFECADGYITLAVGTPRHWANLCVLMGAPDWAANLDLALHRRANADLIDTRLVPWLRTQSKAQITARCQELFIPCGPILTSSEVLADAHLRERDFFTQFETSAGARLTVPGAPFRVSTPSSRNTAPSSIRTVPQ